MSDFVIDCPPRVALPVIGTDAKFPVRRVYCIGRNYAAHAIEMGHDPNREPPFFFQKNADNLDPSGVFPYPPMSSDVHHEVELAVMLGAGGRNISTETALSKVYGYAIALDMTRRDLQGAQKKLGRPWEIGKAFESAAPVGPVHPATEVGHRQAGRITLHVNGTLRQDGNLAQMIWKLPEQITYLSEYYELSAGDVILSGTPSGVAAVARGDSMVMAIEGLGSLEVAVE
jgi:fumarylpyruvate hydrolase